jgi:hypothetical protein
METAIIRFIAGVIIWLIISTAIVFIAVITAWESPVEILKNRDVLY